MIKQMKRSRFITIGAVALAVLLLASAACIAGTAPVYNVMDYGATGNGVTDDTAAIQSALSAANAVGGGIVWLPRGTYNIASHLTMGTYTTIAGESQAPVGCYTAGKGSVLLASEARGNANGTPFITMGWKCGVKGLIIYYPQQSGSSVAAYPWTIRGNPDNPSIMDVTLVNSYQGIDLGSNGDGRFYVRGVYGQPLYRGIWVDCSLDIGRIENVHFWPLWSSAGASWSLSNGIAFYTGRNDWGFMANCSCSSYWSGYFFYIGYLSAPMNGQCDGLSALSCVFPLYFTGTSYAGTHITNGHFSTVSGGIGCYVDNASNTDGVLTFDNCEFSGPGNYACYSYKGSVTYTGCTFRDWTQWGVVAQSGQLTVDGCWFATSGNAVNIASPVTGAVVTANRGLAAGEIYCGAANASIANNIP